MTGNILIFLIFISDNCNLLNILHRPTSPALVSQNITKSSMSHVPHLLQSICQRGFATVPGTLRSENVLIPMGHEYISIIICFILYWDQSVLRGSYQSPGPRSSRPLQSPEGAITQLKNKHFFYSSIILNRFK